MYARCVPETVLNNGVRIRPVAIKSTWHKSCLSESRREDEESLARMGNCSREIPKILVEAMIRVTFVTFFVTAVVQRRGR